MEFDPPIPSRSTDELIAIIAFPDMWNLAAVEQARSELAKRNVGTDEQAERIALVSRQAEQEQKREMEAKAVETYGLYDLFWMSVKLPYTILSDWYLKRDGYTRKHKERLYSIGAGIVMYAFILLWVDYSYDITQRKWQNEVNNQDIYEWERDYYSDEEFASRRRESIELAIQTVRDNDARGVTTLVLLGTDTIQTSNIELLHNLDPLLIRDVVFEADPKTGESRLIRVKLVEKADNTRL
ncbi:hypothetical protein RT717_03890 [Imperialibacter roseus]|uniref:DUF5683 domain-containing protein n=1 Tax=Imperialibacter roseus TaxID=1324217 RepID=A0ABZ0IUZ4_9BACT|nr:hypothetical protein [Imperialibacter roseus]WOK07765.1 hypothetical protein RT717_03890 [Imperialibacter roseus]